VTVIGKPCRREGCKHSHSPGAVGEHGTLRSNFDGPLIVVDMQIPDKYLRIIPHCWMGDDCIMDSSPTESHGTLPDIIWDKHCCPIGLTLNIISGNGGRMTPQRLGDWRCGKVFMKGEIDVLDGIDYGEVMEE